MVQFRSRLGDRADRFGARDGSALMTGIQISESHAQFRATFIR
jgi:hypothetical protein